MNIFTFSLAARLRHRHQRDPNKLLLRFCEFSYLFVLGQTLCIAQSFAAAFHLQQHGFVVAVGAAVCTAGHGEVVHCTETFKAGVTAQLMDGAIQDHLMFALYKGWQKKSARYFRD